MTQSRGNGAVVMLNLALPQRVVGMCCELLYPPKKGKEIKELVHKLRPIVAEFVCRYPMWLDLIVQEYCCNMLRI